jgi:carbon-monoxide dehydrogenase medium subunit
VTCQLRLEDERLADVRLAVGSAGVVAARASDAEGLLTGTSAAELDRTLEEAGALAADTADPVEDANGSVEYKRHLVGVLSGRAVRAAIAETQGR